MWDLLCGTAEYEDAFTASNIGDDVQQHPCMVCRQSDLLYGTAVPGGSLHLLLPRPQEE
jgi:hypothetical protein